jgi:argininosuccinate synthase
VAIDGERLAPVELIERLNDLGGRYGVGRGYHLGDTLLGFKGRIGYEAPAAEILIQAHRELEKLVLTQDQRSVKDSLAELYGQRLHQGLGFEPALRDIEALWASSQARVEGRVRVELESGRALVIGLEAPHSMLARQGAVYGERPAAGQSSAGAEWLARTLAEPARLWHLAGEAAAAAPRAPVPGAAPVRPVSALKEA